VRKQPNSAMCFVCGLENPRGLQLAFYQDDDGTVICQFTPPEDFQGYPGWLHGGITTALLDEVVGRAAIAHEIWVATAKLEVRYRQPIALGHPVSVAGKITRVRSRTVEGRADLYLEDGTLAAEAEAVLVTVPDEERARVEKALSAWTVVPDTL
jgi:acyl-coenzyme A thioesterase PaaI-like protein